MCVSLYRLQLNKYGSIVTYHICSKYALLSRISAFWLRFLLRKKQNLFRILSRKMTVKAPDLRLSNLFWGFIEHKIETGSILTTLPLCMAASTTLARWKYFNFFFNLTLAFVLSTVNFPEYFDQAQTHKSRWMLHILHFNLNRTLKMLKLQQCMANKKSIRR